MDEYAYATRQAQYEQELASDCPQCYAVYSEHQPQIYTPCVTLTAVISEHYRSPQGQRTPCDGWRMDHYR